MSPSDRKQAIQSDLSQFLDGHRLFRQVSIGLIRILMKILFPIDYAGLEHIPTSGPAILVGNHTGNVDIPAVHCPVKTWIFWVAKKELFSIPVIRSFFSNNGAIAVDRDKVDLQAARGIFGALDAGRIVAMFPQATRVEPDQILNHLPRTGAAHFAIKTGAPLIPVAIEHRPRLFRRTRVIFGPAFRLDTDPRQRYDHGQLLDFSEQIMQHIYTLIGMDYRLNTPALLDAGYVRRPDGRIEAQTPAEQTAAALLGRLGGNSEA